MFDDLKAPLATVLVFSLAINLALLAPSIFMLQVFDRVLATRSVETLLVMAAIAVATLALMGVLEYQRGRALAAIGVLVERRHGPRLLGEMLGASSRQGTQIDVDGMRDLASVRGFLAGPGVVALCDAPWALVYLALIWLFHPALGALATACTAVLALLGWLNERAGRSPIAQLQAGGRRAARFVDAALRQAEAVTALGMTGAVQQRWQAQTDASHELQLRLSRRGGRLAALGRFSRQLTQVLMLGLGAYLVIREGATPGVMLAATIILARALAPVESLISGWKGLAEAQAAWRRLRDVFARQALGPAGTDLPRPTGALAVEGLVLTPPGAGRPVLAGVSFALAPGQVLAVVGASGSGKTTLARLLVGATRPTAGAVRLDGADLRQWNPARLGAWIGYLPQDASLFDGSVAENIARLGPVDTAQVLAAARAAKAHAAFLRLAQGYDTPVGDAGRRLSGGQRQRVALARALYGSPALVVLDEPDASLDAEGEQALLDAIRGLKAGGTSVVVISQRRAVLSVADSVLVLKDGAVERLAKVEHGPVLAQVAPSAPPQVSPMPQVSHMPLPLPPHASSPVPAPRGGVTPAVQPEAER